MHTVPWTSSLYTHIASHLHIYTVRAYMRTSYLLTYPAKHVTWHMLMTTRDCRLSLVLGRRTTQLAGRFALIVACFHASMLPWLSTYLLSCLRACLHAYLRTCLHAWSFALFIAPDCLTDPMRTCLALFVLTCLHAYTLTRSHAYKLTCFHALGAHR